MTKLNVSSRGWVMIALAGLIVMFGAVKVVRDRQAQAVDPLAQATEVPLNTLLDETPPPMPQESPLVGGAGIDTGTGAPPDLLPPPRDPVRSTPAASQSQEALPTVWVSEEGASAYSQPGFNMPKVRPLKKWEELQIVEATQEPWDRARDMDGQEFWVQKKVVTVIRPQNLSQPSIAEEKVMAFYSQVAEGQHSDAYTLLSPEWKRQLSFDDFVVGYSRTDSLRSEITNVFELGEDRFQVDVSMEAVEEGEPVDYLGIYTVEKVDGKWFLTSGSLKRQAKAF